MQDKLEALGSYLFLYSLVDVLAGSSHSGPSASNAGVSPSACAFDKEHTCIKISKHKTFESRSKVYSKRFGVYTVALQTLDLYSLFMSADKFLVMQV